MNKIINWNVNPELIKITETLPIGYYNLLFVGGLMAGHLVIKKIFIKENINLDKLEILTLYIFFGTILGARLGHCLFYDFSYFSQHPLEILLPIKKIGDTYQYIGFRGLASHGGAIGVLLSIYLFSKKHKISLLWILDRVAIATPLTASFIRIGNLMNSEIYGKPTNGNWGFVFERDDLIPRHPTQIYEALAYLLIFGILIRLYKNKDLMNKKGLIFGVFLMLLFSSRFIIEFFKENQVGFENSMLINMGQVLSVPFVLIGIFLILKATKLKKYS